MVERDDRPHADVRDEVGEPGTGLVCFGSFAFADEPGDSVLVVPEVVVGRRGDMAWLTTTVGALTAAVRGAARGRRRAGRAGRA